jgi:hypothetical protein
MSSLRERCNVEIEALGEHDRTVKQETVVAYAKSHPGSALHEDFDRAGLWNDEHAAHQARLDHAGRLIRVYRLRLSVDDQGPPVRALVSLIDDRKPKSGYPGYRFMEDVMSDEALRENYRQTVLMECRSMRRKYEHLKEFEAVWDAMRAAEKTYGKRDPPDMHASM